MGEYKSTIHERAEALLANYRKKQRFLKWLDAEHKNDMQAIKDVIETWRATGVLPDNLPASRIAPGSLGDPEGQLQWHDEQIKSFRRNRIIARKFGKAVEDVFHTEFSINSDTELVKIPYVNYGRWQYHMPVKLSPFEAILEAQSPIPTYTDDIREVELVKFGNSAGWRFWVGYAEPINTLFYAEPKQD